MRWVPSNWASHQTPCGMLFLSRKTLCDMFRQPANASQKTNRLQVPGGFSPFQMIRIHFLIGNVILDITNGSYIALLINTCFAQETFPRAETKFGHSKKRMWNILEIRICTAAVDESEEWSSQEIFQFKQWEVRSLKNIRASTGFKPVTSTKPVRCSTNWADIWTQQIDLAPNVWFHSWVGRASHRYRGGHGFESR